MRDTRLPQSHPCKGLERKEAQHCCDKCGSKPLRARANNNYKVKIGGDGEAGRSGGVSWMRKDKKAPENGC